MTVELAPCPLCGGENINHTPGVFIGCMNVNCGCNVEMGAPWGGPKADGVAFLVKAWNRRPELRNARAEQPTQEAIRQIIVRQIRWYITTGDLWGAAGQAAKEIYTSLPHGDGRGKRGKP